MKYLYEISFQNYFIDLIVIYIIINRFITDYISQYNVIHEISFFFYK